MSSARFQDKAFVVTGSTMGIGLAIAERLIDEGARVIVHGLEPGVAREVCVRLGDRALPCVEDLEDAEAPARVVGMAADQFGKLDGLVNNAAMVVRGRLADTTPDYFDQIMRVNVRAPLLMIQTALPMLRDRRGSVVNIGSVNAYCGEENLLPYSISKGALMTMTRNLGDTLHREDGVRVNQVNPGWVLTENEVRRKRDEGMGDNWYRQLPRQFAPAGRILYPAEIASTVVHLLSDECGPVSGAVIDCEQHPFIGRNPPKC